MIKKLTLGILSIFYLNSYSQVVTNIDWIKYKSERANINNVPSAIDATNNAYITGYMYVTPLNANANTIKYDPNGVTLWTNSYDNGGFDNSKAIALDAAGNTYITGESDGSGTGRDIVTIKINPSGLQVWAKRYNGVANSNDVGNSIVLDPSGNVYVTGYTTNSAGNRDYITLKYNSSGAQQFAVTYAGAGNQSDEAIGIAYNNSRLYITGTSINASANSDLVTLRLNPANGATIWIKAQNGSANNNDMAYAMLADGNNVVVVGNVKNTTTGNDYITVKYNGNNGAILFNKVYDYLNSSNIATALVKDSAGNYGVTGTCLNGTIYEYHTIKYSNSGVQQWVNKVSTNLPYVSANPQIAVDTIAHHFYVSGQTQGVSSSDIFVYQITPGGNKTWDEKINGTQNGTDAAVDLVVNSNGIVYVAGVSRNGSAKYDYTTVKISQTPVYFPIDFNNVNEATTTSHLFYPNSGEILLADTTNTFAKDVEFYTMYGKQREFILKDNKIAFITAKPNPLNPKNDSLSRIDLEFHKSNLLSRKYRFEIHDSDAVLNYFLGQLGKEITNIKGSSRLMIPNLYPNIDLHLYSNNQGLKMYFVVKPGADAKLIKLKLSGVTTSTNTLSNQLIARNNVGTLQFEKLQVYSVNPFGLITTSVISTWNNQGGNIYGINTSSYNNALPLIIQINQGSATQVNASNTNWSTYFGGIQSDRILKSKCDATNNLYVAGETISPTLPLSSVGTFSNNSGPGYEGFISKFTSSGELKWSTFIGSNGTDQIKDFDFKGTGVYCVGITSSYTNIPIKTKTGAYNKSNITSWGDAFIFQTTINGDQNDWFTLYGGNGLDEFRACKFDGAGNFFVVGVSSSTDIPTVGSGSQYIQPYNPVQSVIASTLIPFNGTYDGIITKFNTGTSAQSWATYLGTHTSAYPYASDLLDAIDINGNNVYIAGSSMGYSLSASLNTKNTSIGLEGIVANFNTNGNLLATRYTGNQQNNSVKFYGNKIHLCGIASNAMPILNSNKYFYNTAFGGQDANLTIYNSNLNTLIHSTFIGGPNTDVATDLQFNSNGVFYITGVSQSPIMVPAVVPTGAYFNITSGSNEYFIQAHYENVNNYVWNTFLGSNFDEEHATLALDNANNIYLCGSSTSYSTFPLNNFGGPPAYYQPLRAGSAPPFSGEDATITRFNLVPINAVIGIKENQNLLSSILVYPNPATNYLIVDYSKLNTDKFSYAIYNITGQVVKSDDSVNSYDAINVSNLTSGVYFLNIKSQNGNFISKFIKANN